MPNHYAGDLLHSIAISGPSRVRAQLFELAVVPALASHPVQMHRQLARHRYLGNLSSAPRREVEESTAPHNRLPMATNYSTDRDLLVQTFWEANPVLPRFD